MSLVNADIQKHYPNASRSKVGESLMKELSTSDLVACQLVQKFVKAEVVDLIPSMKAVLLSFEDFPSIYDEWVPHDRVRLPSAAEIAPVLLLWLLLLLLLLFSFFCVMNSLSFLCCASLSLTCL